MFLNWHESKLKQLDERVRNVNITEKEFGRINNEAITLYTVTNDQGFQVSCMNYGCIITEILTPDRNGDLENVVLGYEAFEEYESNPHYFGAVVGRFAGRIKKGAFAIGGKEYQVPRNADGHHLHGGPGGFHAAVWQSGIFQKEEEAGVEFTHFSPAGEEGFPGNLSLTVRYTLKNGSNQLVISYSGKSDQATVLNVTNHSYFNLSGNFKRTVLDHDLILKSGHYLELDRELLPTGALVPVDTDPMFDFSSGKTIREATVSDHPQTQLAGHGYDHPFLLNKEGHPTIELNDEKSGRKLQVDTTEPAVVLYTGNHIGGDYKIRGVEAKDHLGLCLETQGLPDSMNHPHFPSAVLDAEEEFKSATSYTFSAV